MIHNDNIIQTLLNETTSSQDDSSSITNNNHHHDHNHNHNHSHNHNQRSSLRVKRDRPSSPFIDGMSSEITSYSSNQQSVPDSSPIHSSLSLSSSTSMSTSMENEFPRLTSKSQSMNFPRSPLKNLSNLVIPSSVKSKTKQLTNSFSRSMSEVVSKSSHSFFNTPKIEFNSIDENDDIPTNYDSEEDDDDVVGVGVATNNNNNNDDDDEEEEDDDEDGEDTFDTINIGSPIRRNNSNSTQNSIQTNNQPSKIRRFHSMYQTNKEISSYQIHEDNSILKFTNIEYSHLDSDLLPRITVDQLFKILCGEHNHEFDEFIIIDCRFDYEYEGGHIINAINISSKEELESNFINNQQPQQSQDEENKSKKLIIFHCEFSVFRGPMMAKHLRRCDRMLNYDNYPKLTYPDVVILEGGYKRFYENYSQWCNPQGYIEMKQHEKLCESNLDKIRRENKLTRHKSYQFGSNNLYTNRNNSSKDQLFWGLSTLHCRSQSYTTITNEKIIKRQRSIPKVKESSSPTPPSSSTSTTTTHSIHRLTRANTISLDQPMFTNKLISSPVTSPTTSTFELNNNFSNSSLFTTQDFQPPSASFRNSSYRNHRRSISSNFSSTSINSINSTTSSNGCSDSGSIESTLTDPYISSSSSPVLESSDYFDTRKPTRPQFNRKQGSRNIQQSQSQGQSQQQLQFQFPKSRSSNKLFSTPSNFFTSPITNHSFNNSTTTNTNTNTNTNNNTTISSNNSGPIHSPFLTPATTSCDDNTNSSIIDPINDTPVDFLVPISTHKYSKIKLHKRSGSLLSSTISENKELYSFAVDEDEEE